MNEDQNRLTLRDNPIVMWIIGLFMILSGAVWIIASPDTRFFAAIDLILGSVLFLFPKALTVTADRTTQMITLDYRGILGKSKKEIPIRDVSAVQLQSSRDSEGSSTYRIAIICKDGQAFPFHTYYSSGTSGKQKKVDQLRAFLGVGGQDASLGGLSGALQMVQERFQEQQQALTGSPAEEHVTDGVHWQLQTLAFGGTAITRWFSPDSTFPDGFLYLAQKPAGQKLLGGLMGGVSKFLAAQSLKLYGFGPEDAPGAEAAEVLTPVDTSLDPHFETLTTNPTEARQKLNPWVIAPLVDWATRYPLKSVQMGTQVFGQLVVLFSPKGLYIANFGILIPEAVDELTNLGVQLVKAG